MKRRIFVRLLALVCVLAIGVSISGCAPKGAQKALSLEGGWYSALGSEEDTNKYSKGFTDSESEPLSISQLSEVLYENTGELSCFFSNTFTSRLAVNGNEKVILDLYDAKGEITLWLNGKEIAAEQMNAGKYSFDVTKEIKAKGNNALVIKAASDVEAALIAPASRVDITVHSAVGIYDVYTVSDTANNLMKVYAVINNTTDKEATLPLTATLGSVDNNAVAATVTKTVTVPVGESLQELEFNGENLIGWSNENPFIYLLKVETDKETYSDYVGYKSFEVDEEGFFLINGKPIMIKSAIITEDETYVQNLYELLNYIKVAGFNTVTVGDGVASERLLEYCDRLGLLVYEGEATVEVAKRDRSHVSLSLAKGNLEAWQEANAGAVVIDNGGVNYLGEKAKVDFTVTSVDGSAQSLSAYNALTDAPLFVESAGVSGLKDGFFDAEISKDWFEAYGLDTILGIGEVMDRVNKANTFDNSYLLDYVRAKKINALCFSTDISRQKTSVTEDINDDINDLRFTILSDKANAFNTDTLNLNVSLANFNVLTKGVYVARINITGEGNRVYNKDVEFEVKEANCVMPLLSKEISLAGFKAGEYVISAEIVDGAHAVCKETSLIVHDSSLLPKVSGKVYTLDVTQGVTDLLKKQGAEVYNFAGTATADNTIIIGEACENSALIEKAYASGAKVLVLGAENKSLPVDGYINGSDAAFIHNNELTKGFEVANVVFEANRFGNFVTDNAFVPNSGVGENAISTVLLLHDGTAIGGTAFGVFEGKYAISTLNFEDNISNPYIAYLLLNFVNLK